MSVKEPKWQEAFGEELAVVCGGDQKKKERLVGLAFSGGGIRSATFNLGVLEALKGLDLLKKIDYLSTVSGGGYIGAWLTANCKRNPKDKPDWRSPGSDWSESIRYLRRYSNYLSPSVGFFSADTWSMAMVWLRNTLLVQVTVILAIAIALIVPRLLFPLFANWHNAGYWRWITIALYIIGVVGIAGNQLRVNRKREDIWLLKSEKWWIGLGLGAACLAAAVIFGSMSGFDPFHHGEVNYLQAGPIAILLVLCGFFLLPVGGKLARASQINYSQPWVQGVVVAPMIVAGLLVAAVMWGDVQTGSALYNLGSFGALFKGAWKLWPFPLTVIFCSLALLGYCSVKTVKTGFGILAVVLAPVASTLVLHALFCALALLLQYWARQGDAGAWNAFAWAPAAVIGAFSLTIVVLMGMVGRQSREDAREWWSRLGAWLCIYGVAWAIVSLSSIYGPYLVMVIAGWKYTAGAGWIGSTMAGLFAGNSSSTGGKEKQQTAMDTAKEIVAAVAPFVFIAGLLVAVASLVHLIVRLNSNRVVEGKDYWHQLNMADYGMSWILFVGCAGLLMLFAARVDINEFSLNAFYRSRLVRCYLGATRKPEDRNPQAFTNFDGDDDMPLEKLVEDATTENGPPAKILTGPLHIINCALNLGGSSDLTLHTRHSAIFTLTPLHCGSRYMSKATPYSDPEEIGYVSTSDYGGAEGHPSLGQSISVSGAAASPNMGYHTSPVVAFLMTLFNVRLGWWFPKPDRKGSGSASPWFSLRYLVMELFGLADDRSGYLAISDGGHFENLAAYELIKRRCKVVIVGDAECDPDLKFEGLGTLIRMCEVDFNAKIKIDVRSIGMDESGWSHSRCAVGTIEYDGNQEPKEGILIYLKASLAGHEDTAIQQYKSSHATFPHETTSDQFYGEDQFESYRVLGKDIATATFAPAMPANDMVTMAKTLVDVWSPSLRQVPQFTQNSTRLMELWANIGNRTDLNFLDLQLAGKWPDKPAPEFRSGFYVGSQLLQLMENVYLELRLEETWDHADNKGWKELFLIWAKAGVVKDTWALTGETYGIRFRHFCVRKLSLPLPGQAQGAHA